MAHFSRSLSLLFAAAFSWGSAASADTLLEIYELALKNDPVLKSAEASFRAGQEAEVQGRSALLPQVGAQATYGESDLSTQSKSNFFSNGFVMSIIPFLGWFIVIGPDKERAISPSFFSMFSKADCFFG